MCSHVVVDFVYHVGLPRKLAQHVAQYRAYVCKYRRLVDAARPVVPVSNQPGRHRDLAGLAASDSEWQRTDYEDKGAELSFQGAELQRQPLKMDQEGRTDGGATSAANLMVPTELTTPDLIEAYSGDKVDTFDQDSRRGDTSPPTNPQKQQTHRNRDKHRCRFCPHSCPSAAGIAIHERTHTGERPFSCDVCEKTFARKANLKAHVRTHTGEKPFKCNTCSRAFAQRPNLAVHEKIHTGEKPFKCNTCCRAFTQKTHLASHERTHTGEKPFKCNTCSRAFTQK
ncbi:zinc finger protein 239-like [Ixodes scapularis]